MEVNDIISKAERLCRRVAPRDLAGVPLYVVPQSRLPRELGGRSVCYGYTHPRLDLHLKDYIADWQGRGHCLVVNDCDLGQLDARDAEAHVRAVALHELGHILERPADGEGIDERRRVFEALCVGYAVSREAPTDENAAPPFRDHGLRFVRTCLHLWRRAQAAGWEVPLSGYCAGRQYGLSHINMYREALGDEPRRLAGYAIRDIINAPYPREFRRLWDEDMAHWFSCNPLSERSLCECPFPV